MPVCKLDNNVGFAVFLELDKALLVLLQSEKFYEVLIVLEFCFEQSKELRSLRLGIGDQEHELSLSK